jgi:hypothetical protein
MREQKLPADKSSVVQLRAARNEFEPFQLVLRPSKPLKNVKVTAHTLAGPKGAKIAAWNITVRNVEYLAVTQPTSDDVPTGMYPDPLPEHQPFAAPKGLNSPVWITVYVPPDAAPGDYKGTVDLTADGLEKLSVPVQLHVWNFVLPSVSKLRTAFGRNVDGAAKYQGATTLAQKRKLLHLYNLDFWRHRVSPYKPYQYYEIKTALEKGTLKVDFSDFDIAVQKYFPLFNGFMLQWFGMGSEFGVEPGADYERLKIEYMRTVAEHLADKGQLDKAYNYIFDEPSEEQYAAVVEAAKLCRMADQRIKVLLTEQIEAPLIGSVDIWSPVLPNYEEKSSKERQAAGEEVWWYVCCGPHHPYPNYFIDYPAVDQRILSWISWRYGVNGILYWETTYWRDNPWEVAMSYRADGPGVWGNGDGKLLYPATRKPSSEFVEKGPVPSIRWEIIRESVEDYDYFWILRDRIKAARAAGKPEGVIAKAEEALKLVDACAPSRTEYTHDPARLEQVRIEIAKAIESL